MECPVCFEFNALYRFKGCTHSVCKDCAAVMGDQPKHQVLPFGEFVEIPEMFVCLECPLCRAKEPNPITPKVKQRLIQKYPQGYRVWLETTLFSGEDGTWCYSSRRKNNVILFPNYDDDLFYLLDRIEFCSRTKSCLLDDTNLYADPAIFLQWFPIPHIYPYTYSYSRPIMI
jgi:hypothetical protein